MDANPLYVGTDQFCRPSGKPGVRPDEHGRDAFRKDYSRLLHAPSFRRLQGKTQLFPGSESDFFRNRLTHSLEVAQIAHGIASTLNEEAVPSEFPGGSICTSLVEFAALAHDLGHPPFGHNGEHALDELMREHGGFEGNAQTLRILAAVERKLIRFEGQKSSALFGLDLTYRSLASVLKYDQCIALLGNGRSKLHKGYYTTEATLVDNIKRRVAPGLPDLMPFKTIECAIMDMADDIAYSTYDLEDSLHAGFLTPLALTKALASDGVVQTEVMKKTNKALLNAGHSPVGQPSELLRVLAEVFHLQLPPTLQHLRQQPHVAAQPELALLAGLEVWLDDQSLSKDSLYRTQLTAERVGRLIASVKFVANKQFPQLSSVSMERDALLQVEVLKHLNYELVIRSPRLAVVEHRGRDLVATLFNTLWESKGSLLPEDWRMQYEEVTRQGITSARRFVCDYVACMTDRYAAELHSRLFSDGFSMFKPL